MGNLHTAWRMNFSGKFEFVLHLQDIVTESASFDLISFMPLLQERILTRNPFARQFIVSWVCVNIFCNTRDVLKRTLY